jgi:hypothetical protein
MSIGSALLEWWKLIGATAGLATAAFLFVDRYFKDRPVLRLHRRAVGQSGDAVLRILNPADDDLLIPSAACEPPGIMAVASDDSAHGIATAAKGAAATDLLIGPHLTALLPFVPLCDDRDNETIKIVVNWRRSARPWLGRQRSTLRTTKASILAREKAKPVSRDRDGIKI